MKQERKADQIRISVRSLVEFLLKSGNIDQGHGMSSSLEAMQEGGRIHRKLQSRMGSGYQAEAPLSGEFLCGRVHLLLEGRADGIFPVTASWLPEAGNLPAEERSRMALQKELLAKEQSVMAIDEIKGIYRRLDRMTEPVPVHLAQAKCYAYLYILQHSDSVIGVQMTYCNLDTEELRYFKNLYTREELREWFEDLLESYRKWAEFQADWRQISKESAARLTFPYVWRTGQKQLAFDVYRTILRKKKLFIQAPTGTGKTLSTVFPAVKAIGEGLAEKLFYLTAKTVTGLAAQDTFLLLHSKGLRFKVLTLTAKEKTCPYPEAECNSQQCPRALGHYDRVNDAVYEMLTAVDMFGREALLAHAEKWQVCPYEFSLDLSNWVDALICDYNYVFDPRAHLRRFFQEGQKGEYLFLIDEAHNLVDRGREMFSASLYKEDFLEVKKEIQSFSGRIAKGLEKCNRQLLEMKRETDQVGVLLPFKIQKDLKLLPVHLQNVCSAIEDYMDALREGSLVINPQEGPAFEQANKKLLDLYFQMRTFLETLDRLDDHYVMYTELQEKGSFLLRLYCVDIAGQIQECLDRGRSTIFFSATLLPVNYYKKLLSTDPDNYAVYAATIFPPDCRQVLIGTDTSSRYSSRGAEEYEKIARYIQTLIRVHPGNYMVFFPSYRMLEDVADAFSALEEEQSGSGIRILLQTPGMKEAERETFLQQFRVGEPEALAGFCVLGGIFSEGIDLREDHLIGAIIVGTGLPQLCNEREILKKYYDNRQEDGFFYAYLCPGMNKVLQAAGRVIRTEQDRGIIALLDDRFARKQYRCMFPIEWQRIHYCTLSAVKGLAEEFWQEMDRQIIARESENQ